MAQEQQIDAALDIMIDEIFQKFSANHEELTYDEWAAWFTSLEGMKECLENKDNKRSKHTYDRSPGKSRDRGYLDTNSMMD